MIIRQTTMHDIDEICTIYAAARDFMRDNGNPNQWSNNRPTEETIEHDIEEGNSYVCVHNEEIAAVFFYNTERDPTYEKIDGAWINDDPYGVVHRIARARNAKGTGSFCLDWCFRQCHNLRVDTHHDNAPMRKLLDNLGFKYCGIIWLENGDERLAYQKADIKP